MDERNFVRAVRYHKNYQLEDLWYDTPEGPEILKIYNIEDIFNLRILFGIRLIRTRKSQLLKDGIDIVSLNFLLLLIIIILIENFLFQQLVTPLKESTLINSNK